MFLQADFLMKFIGIIFVVSTVLYGGFAYASSYKNRRKKLEIIIMLIERIREEIRFSSEPLDVINERLSKTPPFNQLEFIKKCEVHNIPRADLRFSDGINESDEQYIKGFFGSLGNSDIESEIKICDKYIFLLGENYNEAKNNEKEKSKLVRTLTLISSLAIVIMIV